MAAVSLLKQDSYEILKLEEIFELSLKNIGFDPAVLNGKVVAVKPNLLTASSPEDGIVTHPEFFRACIRYIKKNGGDPVLVECPAFLPIDRVLKKTGYSEIIEQENLRVSDTRKTAVVKFDEGRDYRVFHLAEDFVNADFIFNLPKLKTHGLTYFTGAVKNLFGTIHGLEKSKWHFRANTPEKFTSFLMDLYGAITTNLDNKIVSVMDGIIGLEGEGPGSSGKPAFAGAVIAGFDAVAVDTVAVQTAGLDLSKAVTCAEGGRRGLGISSPGEIDILGNNFSDFNNSFIPPQKKSGVTMWPFSSPAFKNMLIEKPVPHKEKCTLCYQCRAICPAGAISESSDSHVPSYDYSKCIRCYCCMEICPEGAIDLKKGIVQKIIRY